MSTPYTYDIPSLQAGDILLSTTEQKPSRIIRAATGSDFSHAMLYVRNMIIHADGDGVFTTNPQRRLFGKDASVVLRLRQPHSIDLKVVCDYAVAQAGTLYTVPEAVLAALMNQTGATALSPDQFCSRLVAQAYAQAGLNLVSNENFCVPGQFLHCPLLDQVPGGTRPARPAEIALHATRDTVKVHQEHTFRWLNQTRRLAKSAGVTVSSISTALDFVHAHPEHDDTVATFIEHSGYLDDYLLDCEANPYRYDADTFRALLCAYPDQVAEILASELSNSDEIVENILTLLQQLVMSDRRAFQLMANTQRRRLIQVRDRIEIARSLCEEHGLGELETEAEASVYALDRCMKAVAAHMK